MSESFWTVAGSIAGGPASASPDLSVYPYGVEAGNLALKFMAKGGVYLGGGMRPKIIERLRGPRFMQGFFNKGRMRPLLEAMPVRIIVNDLAALFGPALYLAYLPQGSRL